MWQAQLDENGIVLNVNNWEHEVGIPCPQDTPIGWQWNGTAFVEPVESIIKRYDDALLNHFDTVAQSKKYDNRITCALRAGYPSAFQQEGIAFGVWMDACNVLAYGLLGEVLSGHKPLPTIEEFIASLPAINWS